MMVLEQQAEAGDTDLHIHVDSAANGQHGHSPVTCNPNSGDVREATIMSY